MNVDGVTTEELNNGFKSLRSVIEKNVNELPEEQNESVNHPLHYNHGGRETIDIIKEHLNDSDWNAYQGGMLFNVYKYIDRASYKGKRLEDLKKAAWYLNKLIEEVGDND